MSGRLRLRATSETISSGALTRTLNRGYDNLGRPDNVTLLSGTATEHRVGYGYDTAGRMQTVARGSGAGAKTFTYGYVPNSARLIATVIGPVHTVTNTWEPNRDVLQTKENKLNSSDTVISRFDYAVNVLGQRTDVTYSGTAFGASSFNLYGYDALGQLISGQRYIGGTPAAPNNPVPGQQFGYDYDLIGNRLTSTDGNSGSTYTPNALNQYETVNAATLTYDDDRNLLNDGTQSYQWDAENRLIKVTRGSVEVTSAYDAQSRRVRKTVRTDNAPTSEVAFLYDGWNVVAEYDLPANNGSPVLHAVNTWGVDLSGNLQGAGGVGGLLESVTTGSGGTTAGAFSYTFDGNGNVSELIDQNGNIAAHYDYGPFGETLNVENPIGQSDPFRWSTKYTDDETGLVHYIFRYYSPSSGRWVSRDPVEERGNANLYAFVINRPLTLFDPLGLSPETITENKRNCKKITLETKLRLDKQQINNGPFSWVNVSVSGDARFKLSGEQCEYCCGSKWKQGSDLKLQGTFGAEFAVIAGPNGSIGALGYKVSYWLGAKGTFTFNVNLSASGKIKGCTEKQEFEATVGFEQKLNLALGGSADITIGSTSTTLAEITGNFGFQFSGGLKLIGISESGVFGLGLSDGKLDNLDWSSKFCYFGHCWEVGND